MSHATSSAQPVKLYRYADVARNIDHELAAEAGSLGAALHRFESTCREPGFTVKVSHLADALRAYAHEAEPVDRWAQAVGRGFEEADRRSLAQVIGEWLRGVRATVLRPASGGVYSLTDRYAGLTVQTRNDGPLGMQARAIIGRLSATPPPAPGARLDFSQTRSALTQVVWSIRYLVFRFYWAWFWAPLLWLRSGVVRPHLPAQTSIQPPEVGYPSLPPSSAGVAPDKIVPEGRLEIVKWTPEDARRFVLENHGRLPGTDGTEACVAWAVERAGKISGMTFPAISAYNSENWGAYNYIDVFADSITQFTSGNAQAILDRIGPGAVLVYDRGQAGAHQDYGHVAVIERVEAGGVWVSDSNYKGPSPRFISIEDLIRFGLYVIPVGGKPSSKEKYEESKRKRNAERRV